MGQLELGFCNWLLDGGKFRVQLLTFVVCLENSGLEGCSLEMPTDPVERYISVAVVFLR